MDDQSCDRGVYTRGYRRRSLLIGASTVVGTAVVGCSAGSHKQQGQAAGQGASSPGASKAAPQPGGTLHALQLTEIPSLDPQAHVAGTTGGTGIYAPLSTVLRFKMNAEPQVAYDHVLQAGLALSAESPDATTWTLKLRPDAKFHDVPPVNGHAVEAEDIKATFVRALTGPAGALRTPLDMVDPNQIETPSKDSVVFRLKYAYAPFAHTLASPNNSEVLPREALAASYDPAKQVIGSGPFVWDSYTPDVAINLKKNPDYFEKGQPSVDAVQLAVILDPAQQLAQFTAGNLDMLVVKEQGIEAAKKSNPNAQVITGTAGGNNILYFQLGDPSSPFQDIRLRRAISLAIDRQALAKVVYNNHCDLNSFTVQPYLGKWALTMNDVDPGVQQYYKVDLAAAKQLFEQAGGSSLSVRLAYYTGGGGSGPEFVSVGQTLFNMLKELPWKNFNLAVIDYSKEFIGGGKGIRYGNIPNDMLLFGGIAPLSEPDEFLYGYYHSRSTTNQERLKDATLDGMIEKARTVVDEEARRKADLDIQKYIADKMYSVAGLPAGYQYQLNQPWVHNVNYVSNDGKYADAYQQLWLKK